MPIETDNSNHDFVWRFIPSSDAQQPVFFPLRLHKTPDYGWTISFLNDQNQPEFSLPADMFPEVAGYINSYIKPTVSATTTKIGAPSPKIGLPQVGRAGPLPVQNAPQSRPASRTTPTPSAPRQPQFISPDGSVDHAATARAAKVKAEGVDKVFEAQPANIDEDFGPQEGVFLPPGHNIDDIDFDEDAPVFQSFTVPEKPKAKLQEAIQQVSPDEQARILAERQAAASNPAKKGGIKKRHSD